MGAGRAASRLVVSVPLAAGAMACARPRARGVRGGTARGRGDAGAAMGVWARALLPQVLGAPLPAGAGAPAPAPAPVPQLGAAGAVAALKCAAPSCRRPPRTACRTRRPRGDCGMFASDAY